MRRSINIYFCFISLVISASIFGQNNSVMFGGQNGNIEFNDVTIESGDGITFSFWINEDWDHSNYPNGDAIIDFGATSYCTPNSRYIIKKKNGEIQSWFEGGGFNGYGGGSSVSTNMLEYSNQFVHVAITFNGSEGHIYVNGVLSASSSYSYGGQFLLAPYSPNGVPCSNGEPADYKLMGGEGNYFLDAYIDDFSIWSYDLGVDDVNDVMVQGISGDESDLVSYWNFNEGSGTTVYDQTNSGYDGSMNGDVSWSTDVPQIPYTGPDWYVSEDGSDDNNGSFETPFATIQNAINAADDGDSVFVSPGTYIENLILSGRSIGLISTDGPENTVIDGAQNGRVVRSDNPNSTDAYSIIDGFTIRNGLWDASGAGINIYYGSIDLVNLIIWFP